MKELDKTANRTWVLVLVSIASFMVALDSMVVSTSLSTIRLSLGASIEELEWTVNAYILSIAVFLMTAAALGDRIGRRRMFVVGLGVFAAASAACALANNVGWLIAARAVQGVGAAMVMPLGMALLSTTFPPEQRAKALGIFSGVTGLAVLAGPVVGGAIVQGIAWQWIFWINVPIGLLAILLVLNRIKESFGPKTVLDFRGLLLVTGAALGLVWGLVRGNSAGWGSIEVIAALVIGVFLTISLVLWGLLAREPMLPMRLFRSRAFSMGNAANFFLNTSLIGSLFFLAQFLQIEQGYGPLGAGLRLLPWTATLFVVAPIAGNLVNRFGERPLVVFGLILQAVGMAWIGLIAEPGLAFTELVAPMIVAGCGVSMAMPATQNSVMGSVAANEIGKASGTLNMLRQLGGVFGIAILVVVFTASGSFNSAQMFNAGFVPAIEVSAALSLVGAIAGIVLPGRL
jgi:EmrB/QacA subfamily drug resistance transporter